LIVSEQNIEILRSAYAAFGAGDIDAMMETFADDAEWLYPEIDGVPYAGPRKGKDGIREFFAGLSESEDVLKFERKAFSADGDRVIAQGVYDGRVRLTDRVWRTDWVHVIHMREGKIWQFAHYFDTAKAQAAHSR
jgi:ketosteroid isomerase-like protein